MDASGILARIARTMRPHRSRPALPSGVDRAQAKIPAAAETSVINDDSAPLNDTTRAWLAAITRDLTTAPHAHVEQIRYFVATSRSIDEFSERLTNLLASPAATTGASRIEPEIRARAEKFLLDRVDNAVAYADKSFYWPDPIEPSNGRSLYVERPFVARNKFVTKQTPIVSAGSCFAFEIAKYLQLHQFNYIVTEKNSESEYDTSSARWGIIFNTASFRQLVERAFGHVTMPRIVWSQPHGPQRKETYFDPFREDIVFDSIEDYEADYEKHVAAARDALTRMRVFIITLGLNEIWRFKMDGSVFSRSPWRMAPSLIEKCIPTIADNVAELERMREIIHWHNPECKIIVTLSPIPLHATFVRDKHIVEANTLSKSALRMAADEFCRGKSDVFYLPSYEYVMNCHKDPWTPDERHVKKEVVHDIMNMFTQMFVADQK